MGERKRKSKTTPFVSHHGARKGGGISENSCQGKKGKGWENGNTTTSKMTGGVLRTSRRKKGEYHQEPKSRPIRAGWREFELIVGKKTGGRKKKP